MFRVPRENLALNLSLALNRHKCRFLAGVHPQPSPQPASSAADDDLPDYAVLKPEKFNLHLHLRSCLQRAVLLDSVGNSRSPNYVRGVTISTSNSGQTKNIEEHR